MMRARKSEGTSAAFRRPEEVPDQDSVHKASAQDRVPTAIHGVLGKVSDVTARFRGSMPTGETRA